MTDLNWKTPELADREWILPLIPAGGICGNDLAFASMYLWRRRYALQIARYGGCLLRRYQGPYGRSGCAFPAGGSAAERAAALTALEKDCSGEMVFCLLSENERAELAALRPEMFTFSTDLADSDYIYARADLDQLPGRRYMRKRNAISHYTRLHPDAELRPLTADNAADALNVATAWLEARIDENTPLAEETLLRGELQATAEALAHLAELRLRGIILYSGGRPAAMAIASAINADICDVHFEKALPDAARDHAYAVINRGLAQALPEFRWFNREEDVGDENLRRAKESYRPEAMFTRYSAVRKS